MMLVDGARPIAPTCVGQVTSYGSLEEALAALTGELTIVFPRAFVWAHYTLNCLFTLARRGTAVRVRGRVRGAGSSDRGLWDRRSWWGLRGRCWHRRGLWGLARWGLRGHGRRAVEVRRSADPGIHGAGRCGRCRHGHVVRWQGRPVQHHRLKVQANRRRRWEEQVDEDAVTCVPQEAGPTTNVRPGPPAESSCSLLASCHSLRQAATD